MLNYSLIKKELLVFLRGPRSHVEMSQLVGYKFNQWHKWETEQKWLRWDEFINILSQLNLPVQQIFANLFTMLDNPREFNKLINYICAGLTPKQIAEIIEQDEDTIKRWLRSGISPSVETVFKLIQVRQNNLSEFISQIVSIDKIPSLSSTFQALNAHKNVEVQYPFSAAIEACLNLEAYKNTPRHSDEWVSKRTLISEKLVKEAIQRLEKVGTIRKKNLHYELVQDWIQMNGLSAKEAVKIDHYWTQRALDRYSGPDNIPYAPTDRINTNLRSFRVTAVSNEAAHLIQEKLRQTSQDILNICLNDSGPKTEIKVYVSHCFDVQDIHWKVTED